MDMLLFSGLYSTKTSPMTILCLPQYLNCHHDIFTHQVWKLCLAQYQICPHVRIKCIKLCLSQYQNCQHDIFTHVRKIPNLSPWHTLALSACLVSWHQANHFKPLPACTILSYGCYHFKPQLACTILRFLDNFLRSNAPIYDLWYRWMRTTSTHSLSWRQRSLLPIPFFVAH